MWTSRPPLTVGGNGWWEAEEEVRGQVEQDTNRRAWQSGRWPKSCKDLLPFLYARSFLYELDGISKALGVLAKQTWAPPGIAAAQVAWTTALPHLHEVRNSSHHYYEDGVPSVGPCGEPMDLNLAEKDFIRAPGSGVMALIALLGDRYGSAVAVRIGQRLRGVTADTTREISASGADALLLPVLAARDESVREKVDAHFSGLIHRVVG